MSRDRAHLRAVPQEPADPAGKLLPHDLKAEAACLSAAILDTTALATVLDMLGPSSMFGEETGAHGTVLETLRELSDDHKPIDVVTLASALRDKGRLQRIGGPGYLAELIDSTPSVHNVAAHCEIVLEKARKRETIRAAQRIAAEAYGDTGPVDEFMSGAMQAMSEATQDRSGAKKQLTMRDAAERSARDIADMRPGQLMGYSTGLQGVDDVTGGLHPRETLILLAKTKEGKSVLAGQLLATVGRVLNREWLDAGWIQRGGLVFALEGDASDWSTRLACARARVDYHALRTGNAPPDAMSRMMGALNAVSELPIVIDDRKDISVDNLIGRVRTAQGSLARRGAELSLVVLDNIQLVPRVNRGDRPKDLDEVASHIATRAAKERDLANIAWIIVSQVNKEGEPFMAPSIITHADTVGRLSVEPKSKETVDGARSATFEVEYQRRGPPGVTSFWFYQAHTLFTEDGR